ncbi:MAG: sulfatase-like hydrolase/transferase, partial [Chloroflexota bacterium]
MSTPPPSFVLIMTDTQATNVLGTYGHPELRTPRIDQLAAGGVTFDRAYTTCPLCTPARAALFTGRYAHAVGAWANNLPLGANARHMGQRFRDAGYRTAYTGKWHLDGHDYFGTGVCPDGWDDRFWYDGMRYQQDLTAEERRLWRGGLRTPEALRAHDIRPEFTWGHRVSDRAVRFLEEAANTPGQPFQPFLLVVSYDEPHGPFTCPPEYAEAFADYRY